MSTALAETTRPSTTHPAPRQPAHVDTPSLDDPAIDDAALAGGAFDVAALAAELDALRDEILADRGQSDADYIRNLIRLQRRLELAGRAALVAGVFPPAWLAGVTMLSLSKILENMEIGHNVMHGQWDWMRDPDIHSTNWEWDNVCPSSQWKHTHNHMHHQWTNVRGRDADIGYGVVRIDPEEAWTPSRLFQPLTFVGLALVFEYGVGFHDAMSHAAQGATDGPSSTDRIRETFAKIRRQVVKDYVVWPAISVPFGIGSVVSSLTGAAVANVVRNVWSFSVIFCGHFPDGVTLFDEEEIEGETRGDWYRRQVLGSVNFTGGKWMDIMAGNLDHQIEHHLFPDLPANRYAEIEPRVREICARHDIEYNTASFAHQLGTVVRKVVRLAFPGKPSWM